MFCKYLQVQTAGSETKDLNEQVTDREETYLSRKEVSTDKE